MTSSNITQQMIGIKDCLSYRRSSRRWFALCLTLHIATVMTVINIGYDSDNSSSSSQYLWSLSFLVKSTALWKMASLFARRSCCTIQKRAKPPCQNPRNTKFVSYELEKFRERVVRGQLKDRKKARFQNLKFFRLCCCFSHSISSFVMFLLIANGW